MRGGGALVVGVLLLAGCDGGEPKRAAPSTTDTTSSDANLECPAGLTPEIAEADDYFEHPDDPIGKPVRGTATPREAMETRARADASLPDSGYEETAATKDRVVFDHREDDGRLTARIWVNRSEGGGWLYRGHQTCVQPAPLIPDPGRRPATPPR